MKPNHSTESIESALGAKAVFEQKPVRGAFVYAVLLYILVEGVMACFTGRVSFSALPVWALMTYGIYSIRYTIEKDKLTVRQWFLYVNSVDISEITSIAPKRGYFGNYLADFDRLEIRYSHCMRMTVAPKDRAGFVEALKAANPDIEVDESL